MDAVTAISPHRSRSTGWDRMFRTGDLLVRSGLVSFPALAEALASCAPNSYGQLTGRWLAAAAENEALLCETLAGLVQPHPVVVISQSTFDLTLLDLLSQSHASQELFFPVAVQGNRLRLLVTHPERASKIFLPLPWRQLEIEPLIVVDSMLRTLLERAFATRAAGEGLLVGPHSAAANHAHVAQVEASTALPSDLDALLGAFVASVAELPAAGPTATARASSKHVIARIALQKRQAGKPN